MDVMTAGSTVQDWLSRDWQASALPILAAPMVGSLLGVLIVRLPAGRPVMWSRSACEACGVRLRPFELLPLLSYAWLKGACGHCGKPISWFHPAVELAAVAVAVWATLADPANAWISCGLGWVLLTLAWIDWTDLLLPDVLTLPLLVAGLAVTWLNQPDLLLDRSMAAIGAYVLFEGVSAGYRRLRGFDGLGGGDTKLIAAAGAWCGFAALPLVILCSAILGLLLTLALAVFVRPMTSTTRIPFGPCIAVAFWLGWLYSPLLLNLGGF